MLRRHVDPVFHKTSQTNQPGFALTPNEASLHISLPKHEARRGRKPSYYISYNIQYNIYRIRFAMD